MRRRGKEKGKEEEEKKKGGIKDNLQMSYECGHFSPGNCNLR